MTTPAERTRALLQTKDFLAQLAASEQLPMSVDELRQEARRLLRHYPGPSELALAHRALPMFFAAAEAEALAPDQGG